jgi:hypothetical protein
LTVASFAAATASSPALAVGIKPEGVPAGFTDTVIVGMHKPVALAATPDGAGPTRRVRFTLRGRRAGMPGVRRD